MDGALLQQSKENTAVISHILERTEHRDKGTLQFPDFKEENFAL